MTAPIVKSFAGSSRDDRCLEIWFADKVTDKTRAWLMDAINEKARTPALQSGEVEFDYAKLNDPDLVSLLTDLADLNVDDASEAALREAAKRLASSSTPQIAGDVREKVARSAIGVLDNRIGGIDDTRDATEAGYEIADAILALSPQAQADRQVALDTEDNPVYRTRDAAPPFSRWADIIESASLAISPKGSKELDALAAEVRAYCEQK